MSEQNNKRYAQLHKRLGGVYQLKEDNREALLSFADQIKEAVKKADDDWHTFAEGELPDNLVDKELMKRREEITAAFLKAISDVSVRFKTYLETNKEMHDTVIKQMKELMTLHQEMEEDVLTEEEADLRLSHLENTVKKAKKAMTASVKTMQNFEEEFAEEVVRYEQALATLAPDLPFDALFSMHKEALPKKQREKIAVDFDKLHFLLDIFRPWHAKVKKKLLKLQKQQYPAFTAHAGTVVEKYTDAAHAKTANELLMKLYYLTDDMKLGVVMKERYSPEKIEKWRAFYCFPPEPKHLLTEANREKYKYLTDEEWKVKMEKDNELTMAYFYFNENRKSAWYDMLQPMNFTYLPELNEMEGDYWVLYAIAMRDEYENWKSRMEHVETILEYELDPELLFAPRDEFNKAHHAKFDQYFRKLQAEREKMILAEGKPKQ